MAMGNKFMIIKNWSNDGDIFVFEKIDGDWKGMGEILIASLSCDT